MNKQQTCRAALAALLLFSLSAEGAPRRLPGSNTVLGGAMVYNDLWGAVDDQGNYLNPIESGIYTFGARKDAAPKLVYRNDKMLKMRAGCKVNSIYYTISTSNYDSEAYLTTYNSSSWSQRSEEQIDLVNVPSDLTYDPVSGNVYGFFYDETTQEYSRFCRFDTHYGEAELIAEVNRNAFAIAANKDGEIYGIWGYTGWLIKIDPKTGRYEQIGKTGFEPSYTNSMTFDDATGKLYWTANDENGYSALLEVNTTTGIATEICHFKDNASFAGIFAMPYTIPDAAPAAVADAEIIFPSIGAVKGTVKCTAPLKTHNGATLAGPLTIVISVIGGETLEIEGVEPGEEVTSAEITFAEGPVSVEITAATADFLGESVTVTSQAGEDIPGAPTDVTLTNDNGTPLLTWAAPVAGMNGGMFNPEGLTYTVTRMPDGATFEGITATSFRDVSFSGMAALSYQVKAVNSKGASPAGESQVMVFGAGFSVPFTEGFDSADAFSLWTVTDRASNNSWEYETDDKNIFLNYSIPEAAADDWIASPRFMLKKDVVYALTFDAKTKYKNYPENLKFCLGASTDPASMTQIIIDCPGLDNPQKFDRKRALFRVEADGYYHLGLHCYSTAKGWQLIVDNIGVAEVSGEVPSAVADLSVTPAPLGAMSAGVSFTAPTLDSKGATISEPLTVNIYRNQSDEPVHSLSAVAPGSTQSWIDSGMTDSGIYTYRVVAATEAGEGASAEASAFVGIDVPGAVTDLKAMEHGDGNVTISWNAPTTGANGGWFDPAGMTYKVVRSNDAKVIAEASAETTLTDNLNLREQTLMYYLVTPYIGSTKGQYNNTPLNGVFGPAIAAPMTETFPGAQMTNYPWVSESNGPNYLWMLETAGINPSTADQNGDMGLALFRSDSDTKGYTGYFSSPKVSISNLEHPALSFRFYHSPGEGDSEVMTLKVMTPGSDFVPVEGVSIARDNGTTGWTRYVVDLDSYKSAEWLRIMFVSTATGSGNILLDNIVVDERRGVDIAVTGISGSHRIAAGHKSDLRATIANLGMEPASDIALTLTDAAGKILAQQNIGDLGAGKIVDVVFDAILLQKGNHNLTLTARCAADTNTDNNAANCAIAAVDPIIPAPSALEAIPAENSVTLTWAEPYARGNISDNIESYTDWAIDNIGDYTLIDLDLDNTYHINKDLEEYPSMSDPKSFQVCNAKTIGINIWDEGTPHSGNKMLMSMASVTRPNNDWLISPQLNGAEQTVSFFAKAFTNQDIPAERMRVLYSTGSTNPADFTPVHSADYIEVPALWMEYRYVVPAGTRYFAINCVSDDAFALFIDDLAFNDMTVPNMEITGYEVLRNGEVIATVDREQYVDVEPLPGKAEYSVRAIFDNITSNASEPTVVEFSSIVEDSAAAEHSRSIEFYDLQGRRVLNPTRGLYISNTRKLILK